MSYSSLMATHWGTGNNPAVNVNIDIRKKNCQRSNRGFIFSCSPANLDQSTTPALKFCSPTSAFLDLCHLSAKQWVSNVCIPSCIIVQGDSQKFFPIFHFSLILQAARWKDAPSPVLANASHRYCSPVSALTLLVFPSSPLFWRKSVKEQQMRALHCD